MIASDTIAAMVGLCGALVLVLAGLRRRRLGKRSALLLTGAWIGIIAVLWAVAAIELRFNHIHFT